MVLLLHKLFQQKLTLSLIAKKESSKDLHVVFYSQYDLRGEPFHQTSEGEVEFPLPKSHQYALMEEACK